VQTVAGLQVSSVRATILIADDCAEWRALVHKILRGQPQWQIIGEASDGLEGVRKSLELRPDLVILDIGMPLMNGLQAAVKIRQAVPAAKIVFLTQDQDSELRSAALTIGADGYVLKTDAATELFPAISTAICSGDSIPFRTLG
jgi:DNA-binding NarL/FixJ family response regulator